MNEEDIKEVRRIIASSFERLYLLIGLKMSEMKGELKKELMDELEEEPKKPIGYDGQR